jgi:hypothetical protein
VYVIFNMSEKQTGLHTQTKAEVEHNPEEFERLRKEIIHRTDWVRLLSDYARVERPTDPSSVPPDDEFDDMDRLPDLVEQVCSTKADAQADPKIRLSSVSLRAWEGYLRRHGYLDDANATTMEDEEEGISGLPADSLNYWHDNMTGRVARVADGDLKVKAASLLAEPSLAGISTISLKAHGRTPQAIRDAIWQLAEPHMSAVETAIDAIPHEARPGRALFISNLHLLQELGVPQEQLSEWINDELAGFPSWYTEGLGFIRLTKEDQEDAEARVKGSRVGVYNSDENRIDIIADGVIQALKDHGKGSPEEIREQLRHTLIHELAHYAERHTIPAEWLHRWRDAVSKNPTAVSDYVIAMHAEGLYHTEAERLAETIAAYNEDPALLLHGSAEYFSLVNELVGLYPADVVAKANELLGPLTRYGTRVRAHHDDYEDKYTEAQHLLREARDRTRAEHRQQVTTRHQRVLSLGAHALK